MAIKRTNFGGSGGVGLPVPVAGQYFYTSSPGAVSAFTLGIGNLRVAPWIVPAALTIDRLAVEFSVAGEAGSLYRIAIYVDNGSSKPGALLLDAGTVDAATAGVVEKTITALPLTAGVYWIGGVTQNVTTTQPTVRTTNSSTSPQASWSPPIDMIPLGTSLPAANSTTVGLLQGGVTGTAPSTFTSSPALSGSAPRVIARAG